MSLVKPVADLRAILSVPMGNKIGLFLDESLDCLKIQSIVGTIRAPDTDADAPPTVVIPTHPMVVRGHAVCYDDLVFDDPQSGMTRVLYRETLYAPIRGVPWVVNRAVLLPTYLYESGAAPCFDICFVFCEQAAGEEVIARKEQLGTETIFISLMDLRSTEL